MLGAVTGGSPKWFQTKRKGVKKETARFSHRLINLLQKAAGRLAGLLCTEWFIDFL